MTDDVVIRVEGLSKSYQISHQAQKGQGYRRFSEDLVSWASWPFRKAQNLLNNGGSDKPSVEEFWALKDVSFEVKRGEVIGIIGRNGAGKSTLLKILSRIIEPTKGRVEIEGRVASLLEVGTGFHPELTGRENIFLNGAILGMSRAEIKKKFDEIVDFAEVEKFLDTPVKRYSSGMYVRLAFAVAAHLEPEILLVDEVLAVGDADFQKKCLGKMGDVAKEGRTVLFVSHNMASITRLCEKTILLNSGRIAEEGESQRIISSYLTSNLDLNGEIALPSAPEIPMRLRKISVFDPKHNETAILDMCKPFHIQVEYDINSTVTGAHVICFIHTSEGVNVLGSGDADCIPERLDRREKGTYRGRFQIPAFLFGEGYYTITVALGIPFVQVFDRHENIVSFQIFDNNSRRRTWQHNRRPGILGLELPWTCEKLDLR